MFRKNSILVMLLSGLFLSISVPFSNAGEGVPGVPALVDSSNVSDLLGVGTDGIGSEIVIDTNSLDVEEDAYTFDSFDAAISSELVLDPGSYVLNSSGILLQALSGPWGSNNNEDNPFTTELQALVDVNQVTNVNNQLTNVTDAAGVSFTFNAFAGHDTISLDFILASGEYFQGNWDLAGIYINGINYAFLPNGNVLRVNSEAQIANVCSSGSSEGCSNSEYSVNTAILGTISPKLTLYAPINVNDGVGIVDGGEVNTFSASVANTDDNVLGSYLLLSNFQSFLAIEQTISTFTLGDEVFDFGIQIDTPLVDTSTPVVIREPRQSSEITGISVSTADANNNVTIVVAGKFVEEVQNIDVNGRRVLGYAWKQTSTSITLTVPAVASGVYAVDIWNGSAPVLERQTVVVATK